MKNTVDMVPNTSGFTNVMIKDAEKRNLLELSAQMRRGYLSEGVTIGELEGKKITLNLNLPRSEENLSLQGEGFVFFNLPLGCARGNGKKLNYLRKRALYEGTFKILFPNGVIRSMKSSISSQTENEDVLNVAFCEDVLLKGILEPDVAVLPNTTNQAMVRELNQMENAKKAISADGNTTLPKSRLTDIYQDNKLIDIWLKKTREKMVGCQKLKLPLKKPTHMRIFGDEKCIVNGKGIFTIFKFRKSCQCCIGNVMVGVRQKTASDCYSFNGSWIFSCVGDLPDFPNAFTVEDGLMGRFLGSVKTENQNEILGYLGLADIKICKKSLDWISKMEKLWSVVAERMDIEEDFGF